MEAVLCCARAPSYRNQPNSNSKSRQRKRKRRRNFRDAAAADKLTYTNPNTDVDTDTDTGTGTGTDRDADIPRPMATAAVATAAGTGTGTGTRAPTDVPRSNPNDDSMTSNPNKFHGTDDDDGRQDHQTVLATAPWPAKRNVSGYITPDDDLDILPPSAHSRAHSRSNSRATR